MNVNDRGLELIKKYEPEAEIAVGHDEMWVGEYNPDAMTEKERKEMNNLGWRHDEGSWVHFV